MLCFVVVLMVVLLLVLLGDDFEGDDDVGVVGVFFLSLLLKRLASFMVCNT